MCAYCSAHSAVSFTSCMLHTRCFRHMYAILFNHNEGDSCNHARSLSSILKSLKITQELAVITIDITGWSAPKWAAWGWKCGCSGSLPWHKFDFANSTSRAAIFSLSHCEESLWTKASTTNSEVRYHKSAELFVPLYRRYLTLYVLNFWENINIYLHFMSFLHINKTQVAEVPPGVRRRPAYST